MAPKTTQVGGQWFRRTSRRAAPDGTGYFLWICTGCGAEVNGAGLSLYNHAVSRKCAEATAARDAAQAAADHAYDRAVAEGFELDGGA